jgi:uncharacterized membrane-anchored protein
MSRLRLALFAALCVGQLAIPLSMAYRYERTLREGTVYRFRTEPVDPVDAFRGRYVAIRLRLVAPDQFADPWEKVYAVLAHDAEGFATVRALSQERPTDGDWLEGTAAEPIYEELPQPVEGPPSSPRRLGTRIELALDRYYMEEGKAPEADRVWRDATGFPVASARVRVKDGLGAIEGLDVDGVPIERWIAAPSAPR